jgi:hypothetical protein
MATARTQLLAKVLLHLERQLGRGAAGAVTSMVSAL